MAARGYSRFTVDVDLLTTDPRVLNPEPWLPLEAKREWRRIVPELDRIGLLARLDRGVLSTWCASWAQYRQAVELLARDGPVVQGARGKVKHPAAQAARDAAATMLRAGAVQCGFCTPGIVVAASDLFRRSPRPSSMEIKEALAGNICRCTGYGAIIRAFEELSRDPR